MPNLKLFSAAALREIIGDFMVGKISNVAEVNLRACPKTSSCHAESILADSTPKAEIVAVPKSTKILSG